MARFTVDFFFMGGGTHRIEVEADTFAQVTMSITQNRDGWFGKQGDLIHLKNVERVRIADGGEGESKPRMAR
ncbi:hypothetical protein [Paenibacillus flagellatus]|uniref:Uncharacterized protein n=1 Tax=Paenibacillus flagellatus TaxID=2211139 RepID=A0A2V5KJ64_9BACL|nr:hypothetical protein [Paenibacillus flagellatus]PYI50397.1 hypothetical protein DLM86_29580 [Paenibacillus flagellatus]